LFRPRSPRAPEHGRARRQGGSPGGGGGAGLGGGLYVANDSQNGAAPGNVMLIDIIFNRG